MQCPNCRKIEKGQWLFANGCRSYTEFSMDDWTHDEDLYDLSYSEMVKITILLFDSLLPIPLPFYGSDAVQSSNTKIDVEQQR